VLVSTCSMHKCLPVGWTAAKTDAGQAASHAWHIRRHTQEILFPLTQLLKPDRLVLDSAVTPDCVNNCADSGGNIVRSLDKYSFAEIGYMSPPMPWWQKAIGWRVISR
jgi:hypothetical protein